MEVNGKKMGRLSGKVAVITGGNSGLGLATARLFVREGASVVITGRRERELEDAVADIGGSIEGFRTDVSKLADIEKLRDHLKNKYGRVDIIFANAGNATAAPIGNISEDAFDKMIDVNFKGVFFTVQTLLPLIPDGGSIILNASIAASKGTGTLSVYSATKAAVRSLARTWTSDLQDRKIRVNALSPGTIVTEFIEKAAHSKEQTEEIFGYMESLTPLGRNGKPEDVASAALFLASDEASWITGIELTVDGGFAQV
jgi:NAD(P)-dependent dehydrogenase (short-subunit alcohol dehydrogenase family)